MKQRLGVVINNFVDLDVFSQICQLAIIFVRLSEILPLFHIVLLYIKILQI